MIQTINNCNEVDDHTISRDEQVNYISSLFEEVKRIYKHAEDNGYIDAASELELLRIKTEFLVCGVKKGVIFCLKGLSIIYEKRGDISPDINDKINHYEAASDSINEAVIQAALLDFSQPALYKRQATIKSKLADTLHKAGDHYNANILESTAFKIFGKILNENPDYGQGHLEAATASFSKIKWSLRKILCELGKSENLFNSPKHTKHLPDYTEIQRYKLRIEEMRSTINLLIAITN
jgi:hypothetical protein